MNKFFKYIALFLLLLSSLNASPARGGMITFTQADGSKFQGYLRGDSAFHWIESDSHVVLYNAKDKYYYNAVVNENGNLECTTQRPAKISENLETSIVNSSSSKKAPILSKNIQNALKKMQKNAKKGNYPR